MSRVKLARADRSPLEGISDVSREDVQMQVGVRVAVDFVVHLHRHNDLINRAGGSGHGREEGPKLVGG